MPLALVVDAHTLRAGLWLHSSSSKNLTRAGRAMLTLIADGNGYYVRLVAHRGPDLDLGSEGRLAYFALQRGPGLRPLVQKSRISGFVL